MYTWGMASEWKRDSTATRARILHAAKKRFASYGYDRTTVRAIASDAQVAPNLITRYFGGKDGLFRASTEVDLRVADAMRGPQDEIGSRIATHIVNRWEEARGADPILTMLRAAMTDDAEAKRMADFVGAQVVAPLANYLSNRRDTHVANGLERAAAMSTLIMGTVAQRYVLRAGPIAAAGVDELIAWLGASLQRLADADDLPALTTP
jgi:AcrR family transcriptional regulator